jgi:hypothetical protein
VDYAQSTFDTSPKKALKISRFREALLFALASTAFCNLRRSKLKCCHSSSFKTAKTVLNQQLRRD